MPKATDIRVVGTALYFLPLKTRVPLKFGPETVTSVTCARVRVTVEDGNGKRADGWGETPLSVTWVWPSQLPYETRHHALKRFCVELARAWAGFDQTGHPIELGHDFQEELLPVLRARFNEQNRSAGFPPAVSQVSNLPWLAALVCASPFDIAMHDAFGKIHGLPIYHTYNSDFMSRDLAAFLVPDGAPSPPSGERVGVRGHFVSFADKFPADFLLTKPPKRLRAWHLVGGLDPVSKSDLNGGEPNDGYPVLLEEWIDRDGLKCLKIKLRGNDAEWDYQRLIAVGEIAIAKDVEWLSADFNCTVDDPAYVNSMLDRLRDEYPRIYGMLLYVEQPFPYDLEQNRIDVHSVSARKPLFLDESAHDWKLVRLGRQLGWNGVALKTCKTQTAAVLTACWAKAHGMALMVQDLTNPMLAQIPHVLLASRVGTIMGVETNAMQFYPEASAAEAKIHPGLYRRSKGCIDLATINGAGFGYAGAEECRQLPTPEIAF